MKGIKIAVSVAVHHKTKGIRKGIERLKDGTSKSSQSQQPCQGGGNGMTKKFAELESNFCSNQFEMEG